MTTVAALAVDGAVYMAADSLTNVYERPIVGGAHKVRRVAVGIHGDESLVGVCGDGGMADLVTYRLTLDPPGKDLAAWAADVALRVTALAVEVGLTENGRLDGTLLLGYRGLLWTLTHAQAIPAPDGVAALGSGEGPAMGALDVHLSIGTAPEAAVRDAVRIACGRDRNSAGPIECELLEASS